MAANELQERTYSTEMVAVGIADSHARVTRNHESEIRLRPMRPIVAGRGADKETEYSAMKRTDQEPLIAACGRKRHDHPHAEKKKAMCGEGMLISKSPR